MRVVFRDRESRNHTILIESKLGSDVHERQLADYASILRREHSRDASRWLIYVTKRHDPQKVGEIVGSVNDPRVEFRPVRWLSFFRVLDEWFRENPTDHFTREAVRYMEDQGMSTPHQFTPADLSAITGFPRAYSLMNEILQGPVRDAFQASIGKVLQDSVLQRQPVFRNRAVLIATDDYFEYLLGFFFVEPGGYPSARIHVQVLPTAVGESDLWETLQDIVLADNNWRDNGDLGSSPLAARRKYCGIHQRNSLREVLSAEDHVKALSTTFITFLDEFTSLRRQHPSWFSHSGTSSPRSHDSTSDTEEAD